MSNKNAYITLADSEEYLKCAYALALSLNRVKSVYPLYIMVPKNSIDYKDFPQIENTKIVEIPLLMFNGIDAVGDFNTTINKFFCLLYEEFDKIIFLDADNYVYQNIDYLFKQRFPAILIHKDNKIGGETFGLKPDKELLFFIINLTIRYNFVNDEQILAYLFNNYYLPIGSLLNNCRQFVYHDAGQPKMWSLYNYMDITTMIKNNQINFNIPKTPYFNRDLQEKYIPQIIQRIRKKYETI